MVDNLHNCQIRHIQRTVHLVVLTLLTSLWAHIQLNLSRPTTRVLHQLWLRMAVHTRRPPFPLLVRRMARTCMSMMNKALLALNGPEVHSQTKRFATPSSKRFAIVTDLRFCSMSVLLLYKICIAHKFKQARVRGADGVARSGSQRVERE